MQGNETICCLNSSRITRQVPVWIVFYFYWTDQSLYFSFHLAYLQSTSLWRSFSHLLCRDSGSEFEQPDVVEISQEPETESESVRLHRLWLRTVHKNLWHISPTQLSTSMHFIEISFAYIVLLFRKQQALGIKLITVQKVKREKVKCKKWSDKRSKWE